MAGFAGILGMALLPLQPLLAYAIPQRPARQNARRLHRAIGVLLLLSVLLHVIGLWITSPPDVIDALLFRSPTPFSIWGVLAMWALFGAGLLALLRRHIRWRRWRIMHLSATGIL
ncbi:ferric reductase-like transmembrane domain-containing protein, partial [Primorskyibacter sp. S187A]|uniref:ferric reductase-like transmembrane domain-containing protein n=1 Tax=Primorskyibacter sp. S187A TaxID=3415130 RepID=UPI003C7B1B1D